MLRTIFVAVMVPVLTLPFALIVLAGTLFDATLPIADAAMRLWARLMIRAAGIRLRAEGVEEIRDGQRYIFVANHHSYYDIPCLMATIPQPIRFMAKVSLFKIPIFGTAMHRVGYIPIDRQNRRTAVKSFDMAGERIRRGHSVIVFPEEGRSKTREMRPFQRGAFLLALKSELPILPVAIDGTFDVLPVGAKRVRPAPVTLRVGTPIPTAGLTLRDKERLADEARGQILAMLTAPRDAAPA